VASGLSVHQGNAKEFLDFTFTSPYPKDCPVVLGVVVQAFTKYLETSQQGDTEKAVTFIEDARKLLGTDLKEKQENYNAFKATSSLVFVGEKARNLHQERMSQIESTRSNLLIQETQLRSELDAIDAAIAKKVSRETLLLMVDTANRLRSDPNASSPTVSLSSQLLPLIFEEEKLLQSLGSEHPRVREVRRKIELTRAMFEQREPNESGEDKTKPRQDWLDVYVDSLRQGLHKISQQKTDLNALFEQERLASRDLAKQENDDQKFRDDIDRTSRLFDTVLDQLQALNLVKDNGTLKAEVTSPPGPGWQVGPAYSKYLGGGAVVGWLAALCISFLIESSNRGFRGLEDVSHRLQLPVLGTIPLIEQKPSRRELRSKLVDRMGICFHKPTSFASEAYRAVRSAVFLGKHGLNIHVLQITSSEAGAGKSTLSANLAISIAQSGKRCLLIDADCRRPTQQKLFGISTDVGLTNVLQDNAEIPDAIRQTDVERLDVLTAGDRTSNPAELLMSDGFRNFLAKMRETYDFILIDSPPILAVTDASIISPNTDGVLFVTRLGRNARVLCVRGLERLRMVNANVIGIALNAVPIERSEYGLGRYHYGYRYGAGSANDEYFKEPPPAKSVTTITQK
jgi:capsular exopolysaccharide synthesis family protein